VLRCSKLDFDFVEPGNACSGRAVTTVNKPSAVWYHVMILFLLGDFPRLTLGETVNPQSTSPFSGMSDMSVSRLVTPVTHFVTPSPPTPADGGHINRLDFISVAVICGVVAFCFIICVIVGCRRKKRRHHLPRCEDMTPTVVSPSVTGNCL
jgi:hypothetical protein